MRNIPIDGPQVVSITAMVNHIFIYLSLQIKYMFHSLVQKRKLLNTSRLLHSNRRIVFVTVVILDAV